MIFRATELDGAFVIEPEPRVDDRGFFARIYCVNEFAAHGLNTRLVQANLSYNRRAGTVRGMHYQLAPKAETKLVRCTAGAIYDVIVDLRPDSATYLRWIGVELSAANRAMLYVPEGFAHGFQTLTDDAEVAYQVTEFYSPEHERGVRWDDPALNIRWPAAVTVISDKDRNHPDYRRD